MLVVTTEPSCQAQTMRSLLFLQEQAILTESQAYGDFVAWAIRLPTSKYESLLLFALFQHNVKKTITGGMGTNMWEVLFVTVP